MPVFGNEEPAAVARQSSNNNAGAGVPIKKRRFPVFRPPSPPPQEPSSLLANNDFVDNKHPCASQGLSLVNATVSSSSVGNFDAVKNSLLEVKKEILVDPNCNLARSSVNVSGTNPKEPNVATHSDLIEKSQLNLAPNEALAVDAGGKVIGKQHVGMNCKPEPFPTTGCDEFSLGPKEPLVPAFLMGQSREGCHQMPDNLYPSLSLSLSKEKDTERSKSPDSIANNDNVVSANRSNWDLNTTMDAWEGSACDAPPLGTVAFHGSNKIGSSLDIDPSLVSRSELGVSVESGKQILGAGDCRPNFLVSSLPPSQYKAGDLLHLSLSPSFTRTNFSGEHSGSSANINSSRAVTFSKLHGQLVSPKNSTAGINVKPEPFDGSAKQDSGEGKGSSIGSSTIIKTEVVERCNKNEFKLSNTISSKVVEHKPVKSEPTQDSNKGTQKLAEALMHISAGKVIQCQDNVSPTIGVALTPEKSCSTGLPTCSGLSLSGDVSNQSEHSAKKTAISVGDKSRESNEFDGIVNSCRAEDSKVGELPHSRGNAEVSESDEEKINISTDMMEEDSYGSDCESDGNHALATRKHAEGTHAGKEDDEYEDGEVREPVVQNTTVDVPTDEREENYVNRGDCANGNLNSIGFIGDGNLTQDPIDDKDHGEVSDDHIKECVDSGVTDKGDQITDKGITSQESLTVEVAAAGVEAESPVNATERRLHDTEALSDGGTNAGKGTETAVGEVANENANGNDDREKDDSYLPLTESYGQDATKDTDSGGIRSRIINLPRASNVVSPSKTRSIPDRPFLSGTAKERYADFEGELHLRRNRDEIYTDGPRRFARDRFQDQSFRGSGMKYVRGRGRAYNRFDRSEWVSDRKFTQENYNGPADYRFPRNKHASVVGDDEFESDGYAMAPDGALVGTGRGGRKPLNDDFPSFRHPASRRLSPRGRGGPATRGIQIVRRITRNISPSGEEGSDMVGHRHGEKFMRGLPDDIIDPMFTRSQHPNEGLEGQFARGNRKFSSLQRRGLPRVRSKSPMRTRTRSPGPWSSPRRRSPDGYNGIQELTRQRRSPPIYRMERIRSPPNSFPEEIVARRRGSPPYMARPSNDLQLHNHQRSIMPNRRSPSDRPIPRNNRRFDTLDPQERTNSAEYFEGPIRASRFHELGEDGSGDDRRKSGDRRGGRGPFRPSFSGAGGENFRFRPEGGPRPFRFCPEGDSEFIERSNLREREFDRRIKNRPVITPRRIRDIEEQEGDFRQGGPVWHDDGFGDASRGKRRRF